MWTMFGNRETLCSPAGETTDLTGKRKFNRVDHAALAGAIRARNGERGSQKIDIEVLDSPHFLDMSGLDLDHLTSPLSGRVKIFTKSSALGFFASVMIDRSISILSGVTSFVSAS